MAFALEALSPALNPAVRKSRRGSCQKQAFRSGGGLTLWLQDKRVWTGGDDDNAFDLFAMDLLMDAGKTMPSMCIERPELVADEAKRSGVFAGRAWCDLMSPRALSNRRPIMPLRRGHVGHGQGVVREVREIVRGQLGGPERRQAELEQRGPSLGRVEIREVTRRHSAARRIEDQGQ